MDKVKPCKLPGRENYEKIMTWALDVCCSDDVDLAELQSTLMAEAKELCKNKDDHKLLRGILSLVGFCYVVDRMAELSDLADAGKEPSDAM